VGRVNSGTDQLPKVTIARMPKLPGTSAPKVAVSDPSPGWSGTAF
jgi:hypothetical protein